MMILQTEPKIRSATRLEILEIELLSVAPYAQYCDEVPAAIFDAYTNDLRRLQEHWEEAEVLVAEVDGRIAGSVLFYPDASTEGLGLPGGWAGFRKLAVRPEMRGRHIGSKLVERCVELARRLGAPAVGIHTVSFMKAACRIYEQMAFRRCPQYDLNASDMLGMGQTIAKLKLLTYRLDLPSAG
jgi:GNAT superfamily N-acetyltransferase